MSDAPPITNVRFIPAPPGQGNLVGFVRADIADLVTLDLVLVRTCDGLVVAYPSRRARTGHRHATVRPVSAQARRTIEQAVLAALETEGPS